MGNENGVIKAGTFNRIALWDNVKFVMIVLMVIGHFANAFVDTSETCKSIYLFIYAFHMPLFIFIAGLFYSDKNNNRKIVYYASCGFALKIALAIANLIINKSAGFALLQDSSIPWFMFSLAAFQALMLLFRGINRGYLLVFSIIIACFLGYDKSIGDYLYLSRTVVFFPCYLAGTIVDQKTIVRFIEKHFKILMPLSVAVLALWFYVCFFHVDRFYFLRPLFTGRNPFSDRIVKYGPLIRLLCYIVTFTTSASFLVLIPKRKVPGITTLGMRTLNVFFWHWPIYKILSKYPGIGSLFEKSIVGKASYLLLAVLLSIILMAVIQFEFPLNIVKKYCFTDLKTVKQ